MSGGEWILLRSGARLDFSRPAASEFTIEDIAHGLAHTCRFAGQCDGFYSVAEHGVFASRIVPREHALAALLHDATEAFMGDIARPLKALLPDYKRVERELEGVIADRFGLPPIPAPEIKAADMAMLAAERGQLGPMCDDPEPWPCLAGVRPAAVRLRGWSPFQARTHFLARFSELVLAARAIPFRLANG